MQLVSSENKLLAKEIRRMVLEEPHAWTVQHTLTFLPIWQERAQKRSTAAKDESMTMPALKSQRVVRSIMGCRINSVPARLPSARSPHRSSPLLWEHLWASLLLQETPQPHTSALHSALPFHYGSTQQAFKSSAVITESTDLHIRCCWRQTTGSGKLYRYAGTPSAELLTGKKKKREIHKC